jgi:transcriptional regulator with XRE-family HTH domain
MSKESGFGRRVQQRRKALDMTQAELAQRVACARVTIQKIESGRLRPSKQLAEHLAYHLAIPPDERLVFVQWAR